LITSQGMNLKLKSCTLFAFVSCTAHLFESLLGLSRRHIDWYHKSHLVY
jgi:hypothetical protein